MTTRILCSFGPSCESLGRKECAVCHGRFCERHRGHGTGHAIQPQDWAKCGCALVDGKPMCEGEKQ